MIHVLLIGQESMQPQADLHNTIPMNFENKKMAVPMESICGVWIDNDAEYGEKISSFIRSEMGRTVVRADVENISFVQDAPNYTGYFAVISGRALKSKNHKFMIYLTSVLWRMYNLNINSNIVLVVVDEKIELADPEDKSLKTRGQNENLPINLRTLPRVVAVPEVADGCLRQIASKLEGPSLNDSLPIGNIGIGLAWSYFYGFLTHILPDIGDRIRKSEVYTGNHGQMPTYFLILVPESCRTPKVFSDVDKRFSTLGPLDSGIQKCRAGLRRPYKSFVHQIKSNEGDYYFCGEYATPILVLQKMQESKELDEVEVNKQVVLFTHTLRTILQSHPLCLNKAVVASYADETVGLSLADELCSLISTLTDEVLPDQMEEESMQSASSITSMSASSSSSSWLWIGSQTIINTIQIVNGGDGEIVADKLASFCEAAEGDYNENVQCDGLQEFSVKRCSAFEDIDPQLVNPNIVDIDLRLGGEKASDKLFIILTEDFEGQVEDVADSLIQHPVWFPRTTFIIDYPGAIPEWLEKCGADYIDMSKVDMWKRIFGSLYGVASIEGKADERWKRSAVGRQPQKQRLPLKNVAEGLAWAYYHNYLTIIGPQIADRISSTECFSKKKMASKLLILLPHSCYSYPKLEEADEIIKHSGELEKLVTDIAGSNRSYNNAVYKISVGQDAYFACVEYCTPVLVMYEMEAEGLAGLSPMQKAAELRTFYDVLNTILTLPDAPDFCRDIKLIKYDDSQRAEKKLSELLVDVVKECLCEDG